MQIQMSYKESDKGTLYVVPTPIGNMEDMTFRAVNTLKKVSLIAAEDTRHTQRLLTHFDIRNKLVSYHEHNKSFRTNQVIQHLLDGDDVAIVSDAGMPAISDPGYELVSAAISVQIQVVVLPGANAALCALIGSGLKTTEFMFYGFLPKKKGQIVQELERLKYVKATLIFYESPFRVKATIQLLAEKLGDRKIVIAREITKLYEEYIRGSAAEIVEWLQMNEIKGECCIVVEGYDGDEGNGAENWWEDLSIAEHVSYYENDKMLSHKNALKQVALDRKIQKKEVYRYIHVDKKG